MRRVVTNELDKVPHLQSGVLKNEAPSELWEFVNPFFKRNHPELLSKVTRKNNRPGMAGQTLPTSSGSTGTRQSARQAAGQSVVTPGGHSVHLITDGTTEGEAGQLVGPTGQALDLSAIASHLTAIRQAQSTLTADLQALKASNDHLWRETLEAKEKHQTHEETMNLIISFLERLFGTEGEGLRGLKEALRRAGISGPSQKRDETNSGSGEEQQRQKRKRLAIADGSGDDINATMPGSSKYHIDPFKRHCVD
jgi:heat shock transcription factor